MLKMTLTKAAFVAVLGCTLALGQTPAQSAGLSILPASMTTAPIPVQLTIAGPDGSPLRDATVNIFQNTDNPAIWTQALSDAKNNISETDNNGKIVVDIVAGASRVFVVAPRVGFGASTDFNAVQSQQPIVVTIPPLAKFSTLSGTVDPASLAPNETVVIQTSPYQPQFSVTPAVVDSQGHFTLPDLFPGRGEIVLKGAPPGKYFDSQINLLPGESQSNYNITSHLIPKTIARINNREPVEVTVQGVVRDTEGHALPNVTVQMEIPKGNTQLFSSFSTKLGNHTFGVWDSYRVISTTSGPNGIYSFPAFTLQNPESTLTLVATSDRFAPALGVVEPQPDPTSSAQTLHADLVIPSQHTSLTVHISQIGKPVANLLVSLSPKDINSYFGRGNSIPPLTDNTVQKLFYPSATTDSTGTVTFKNVLPGLYNVQTWKKSDANNNNLSVAMVDIRPGNNQTISLDTDAVPSQSAFHYAMVSLGINPGGTLMTSSHYGRSTDILPQMISQNLSSVNLTKGLWKIHYQVLPTSNSQSPVTQTISYPGTEALVAVSPSIKSPTLELHPYVLHPGSLIVRINNLKGKPASGTVVINDTYGHIAYAQTVSAKGVAEFQNMPLGHYIVQASINDQEAPGLWTHSSNSTLPQDAELAGAMAVLPKEVTIHGNEETTITLNPQPVGYIHGTVVPGAASGSPVYHLAIANYTDQSIQMADVLLDHKTNQFLAGPFAAGEANLRLTGHAGDLVLPNTTYTFPITGGEVSKTEISAPSPLSVADWDTQPAISGNVVMSDGVTPAWNAVAVRYDPSQAYDTSASARTDALGRLDTKIYELPGAFIFDSFSFPPQPDRVPAAIDSQTLANDDLIVWLPGQTGATVVPVSANGKVQKIVLPAPNVLHGTVTVAGQPINTNNINPDIEILAAYQGAGALGKMLSVTALALSDGSFSLHGLTKGVYLVQADKDGIWLSAPQTVVVGSKPLSSAITLNIAAPGKPTIVPVVDAHGHLLPGQRVLLSRSDRDGPLGQLIVPESLRADGKGNVYLSGFSAGVHTLTLSTDPTRTIQFTVAPLAPMSPSITVASAKQPANLSAAQF